MVLGSVTLVSDREIRLIYGKDCNLRRAGSQARPSDPHSTVR
jgi:hypothetical protein